VNGAWRWIRHCPASPPKQARCSGRVWGSEFVLVCRGTRGTTPPPPDMPPPRPPRLPTRRLSDRVSTFLYDRCRLLDTLGLSLIPGSQKVHEAIGRCRGGTLPCRGCWPINCSSSEVGSQVIAPPSWCASYTLQQRAAQSSLVGRLKSGYNRILPHATQSQ